MIEPATILVIDDDQAVRISLSAYLEYYGYRVIDADGGRSGLEIFFRERPDLVLVDLRMPEVSGLDVLAIVQDKSPETPVIVVSGTDEIDDVVEALKLGAWDYIHKPIPELSVLLHGVRVSLERVRLIRENLAYQEHLETEVARRTRELQIVAVELQKSRDLLEERVKQRTIELEEANETLRREMTERKRLEKLLMHREKLKTLGAISAEVAHEIRNPLVAIGGFAQRLKNKHPHLRECDIILSESKRLEKILSRIRRYLEPVDLHPEECNVNDIVNDCVNLLSPETDQKRVKFHLDLEPGLPPAYVDPNILSQIVINLIRNATQASDNGETIFIASFKSDRDIHVMFKNRGSKVDVKNPEALFMPFAEGGQSLGLPLSYRLLKDMGGLMSFTNEDEFVVFTVSIPVGDE